MQTYRIFVSSPGDAQFERQRVDRVVARLNGELAGAARLVAVRWETPQRGVPRKYYRLTDAGLAELAQLTHEWNTFAKAMARLLRQQPEKT